MFGYSVTEFALDVGYPLEIVELFSLFPNVDG